MLVNTVSKFKVSALVAILASLLVMKESFLHDIASRHTAMSRQQVVCFVKKYMLLHFMKQNYSLIASGLLLIWEPAQTNCYSKKFLTQLIFILSFTKVFIVRAKKQPWSSSLCHSLVLYTYVELCLRFVQERQIFISIKILFKSHHQSSNAQCSPS